MENSSTKIPSQLLTQFTLCDLGTYFEMNHTPKTYTLGADPAVLLDWLTEHGWEYSNRIYGTPEYGTWGWAWIYYITYNCTPAGPFLYSESKLTRTAQNLLLQINRFLPEIKGWDNYIQNP